jgi:dipeptidyl aminopeptidase/acylaminoacyl peptidase
MRRVSFIILVAITSIVFSSCDKKLEKESNLIPIEDLFRDPEISELKISPDGSQIAFLSPIEGSMQIYVQDVATGEKVCITEGNTHRVSNFYWKGNSKIIYLMDHQGDENFVLYIVNINGTGRRQVTPTDQVRVWVLDELRNSPNEVLIQMNARNPERFDVFKLNVLSGKMQIIAKNPGNIEKWYVDHSGELRLAMATEGLTRILYKVQNRNFEKVLEFSFGDRVEPLIFTFDNKNIYASSNIGRDKQAIVEIDLKTGKELDTLASSARADVRHLEYSPKNKVLLFAKYTTWRDEYIFLDASAESLYDLLDSKIIGLEKKILDHDLAEEKFIIYAYNDVNKGEYFYVDVITEKITKIGEACPWLNEDKMAKMEPIKFQSRDGLWVTGYLTLPKNKSSNLPLVVNVKSSPWGRDYWKFNEECQFLANRGYAVLQINHRGSIGFGRDFWQASFKQWGLAIQNDITDGVKHVIDKGIADPKRVAIYGKSWGGFSALAGVCFTPELYACCVDYAGISNFFTLFRDLPPYWKPYLERMYTMVGNPEKDAALFKQISPIFHVDKIKVPILIAQGENDPRVSEQETATFVKKLKKQGVEATYLMKEGEGHLFSKQENRIEFYQTVEKFLDKHLKAKK